MMVSIWYVVLEVMSTLADMPVFEVLMSYKNCSLKEEVVYGLSAEIIKDTSRVLPLMIVFRRRL